MFGETKQNSRYSEVEGKGLGKGRVHSMIREIMRSENRTTTINWSELYIQRGTQRMQSLRGVLALAREDLLLWSLTEAVLHDVEQFVQHPPLHIQPHVFHRQKETFKTSGVCYNGDLLCKLMSN